MGKAKADQRTSGARTGFWAAIERILSHAEGHGEAYEGATDDHSIVRTAMADSDAAKAEQAAEQAAAEARRHAAAVEAAAVPSSLAAASTDPADKA